eukprot:CAMPEP_0172207520 /NCGR_PEP_ID=MMETSP1050-20130122/33883_1 /TAXON_ID=233186 /ORGANISM="Cryptomonas curvata, Strain CCAP979/52" /LENGTH=77 /DNA_ID=CAMNT_0012886851 /DNA_START=150 /DNA_END=383 /DNA_ORIENTATION=+
MTGSDAGFILNFPLVLANRWSAESCCDEQWVQATAESDDEDVVLVETIMTIREPAEKGTDDSEYVVPMALKGGSEVL